MKVKLSVSALLAAAAGAAIAGPVLDGSLAGDEACYGPRLWTQNVPTGYDDNHPDNVPPSGNPLTATRGVELRIPLSALGLAGGSFKLGGWVVSGDHTFLSNQIIGGLTGNLGNLGNPPIDFTQIANQQWIQCNALTVATAPTIDGVRDSSYGPVQGGWSQNNFTQFGDNQTATATGGGGSEIDYVGAVINGGNLYLFIAGNLEANGNGLNLFFDTGAGGQAVLASNNAVFNNPINADQTDVLNRLAGITFDADFAPDHALFIAGRNIAVDPDPADFALAATLATLPDVGGGTSTFLGNGEYGLSGGALTGADGGAPAVALTIDNSNIAGIGGSPSVPIPSEGNSVGSEIDGLYGYIDETDNRLYLLVTGNLKTDFSNKFFLYVDCQPGGQNVMFDASGAVDIDFGGLARQGPGTEGPGLTFDTDFFADYFVSVGSGNLPPEVYSNAAVLRTNGKLTLAGVSIDYGAFDGGARTTDHPVAYDGPRIDGQDGTFPNIFTQFAPRSAGQSLLDEINDPNGDPTMPPPPAPGLLQVYLNNSNIGGVTRDSAAGAGDVTTGIEFSIDLNELGWDGTSPVRVTGAIGEGGYNAFSNQVIGGLPDGTANLGEVRLINFANIAGNQYVDVPVRTCDGGCPADLSGSSDPNDPTYGQPDGNVDASDFFYFLDQFAAGNLAVADLSGSTDPNDPSYGVPDGNIDASDFFFYLDIFVAGCP